MTEERRNPFDGCTQGTTVKTPKWIQDICDELLLPDPFFCSNAPERNPVDVLTPFSCPSKYDLTVSTASEIVYSLLDDAGDPLEEASVDVTQINYPNNDPLEFDGCSPTGEFELGMTLPCFPFDTEVDVTDANISNPAATFSLTLDKTTTDCEDCCLLKLTGTVDIDISTRVKVGVVDTSSIEYKKCCYTDIFDADNNRICLSVEEGSPTGGLTIWLYYKIFLPQIAYLANPSTGGDCDVPAPPVDACPANP